MNYKEKLVPSLLCGLAFSFTFFFYGIIELYFGNKEEFDFSISHVIGYVILFALLAFALVFLVLFLTNGLAHRIAYGIFLAITVMGYVQGTFLNSGVNSLASDDVGTKIQTWVIVLNLVIWVLIVGIIIFGVLNMKKYTWVKTVSIVLLVLVIGMQLAGCGQIAVETINTENNQSKETETTKSTTETSANQTTTETEKPNEVIPIPKGNYVMTTNGIYEVSEKKNCIVFVLDRFDISYYRDIIKDDKRYFDKFDDFTLYMDNVSTYSRTYPAIASMLSGIDFTGELTRAEYFKKAYTESNLLSDLMKNDYRIKIYTQSYYAYSDANVLGGIAYNMQRTDADAEVKDAFGLSSAFLSLSAYRYLPIALKPLINVSSGTFSGYLSYEDTYPIFNSDDNVGFYQGLKENGLTLDDAEKSFTFIHILGMHDPHNMDENGNYKENASDAEVSKGCMNIVYDYVQELKKLGVYDDTMIIVTGDHPRARDDAEVPSQSRITALFVKEIKERHTGMNISYAQVSQDMLIPSIVKGLELETENEYGYTYRDMENGKIEITRRHIFELYTKEGTHLVQFNINGPGEDFGNWVIADDKEIGSLYK